MWSIRLVFVRNPIGSTIRTKSTAIVIGFRARCGWRYSGFTRKTVDAKTEGTFHWGYFFPFA